MLMLEKFKSESHELFNRILEILTKTKYSRMDQVKFVEDRYGLLTNIFLLALFMALKLFLPALAIGLHNVFNNLIY